MSGDDYAVCVRPDDMSDAEKIAELANQNVRWFERYWAMVAQRDELLAALHFFAYPGPYEGRPSEEEAIARARAAIARCEEAM